MYTIDSQVRIILAGALMAIDWIILPFDEHVDKDTRGHLDELGMVLSKWTEKLLERIELDTEE